MAGAVSPRTVASRLADPAARLGVITALERHSGAHDDAVALAAAPSLTSILSLDAAEVDHALFQRVGLLLARLMVESTDAHAVALAGYASGKLLAFFAAPNVLQQVLEKSADELDAVDAMSIACSHLMSTVLMIRGMPGVLLGMAQSHHFNSAQLKGFLARCSDEQALKLTRLLIELARSADAPKLARLGVVSGLSCSLLMAAHPSTIPLVLELGFVDLQITVLRSLAGSAEWVVRCAAV